MTDPAPHEANIQRAIQIVGLNGDVPVDETNPDKKECRNYALKAGDVETWHIAPLRHYISCSAPLVDALEDSDVVDAFEKYATADQDAIDNQGLYKTYGWWIAAPSVSAIILCLVSMAIPPETIGQWIACPFGLFVKDVTPVAAFFEWVWHTFLPWTILFLLIATPFLSWMFQTESKHQAWKERRGTAEAMRLEIFRRVLRAAFHNRDEDKYPEMEEGDFLLLLLEYFRRWQVEVQRAYFCKRQRDHRKVANKARFYQGAYIAAVALLFLFIVISQLAGTYEQGAFYWGVDWGLRQLSGLSFVEEWGLDYFLYSSLAVIAVAGSYWTYQVMIGDSVRNAARYSIMEKNFDELLDDTSGGRLKMAREEVAKGSKEALHDYVDQVHAIMSVEFNEWVYLKNLDRGDAHKVTNEVDQ